MAASNRSTHAATDSAWRSLESTPLQPYVLSCDREPLNSRLGPADFYPPSSDDPELKLTRETVTAGYKEEIANIDESREVLYSLVSAQALWTKQSIQRCRSVLRARFKAFTTALARRRKVGQVFGVPLSGLLLARPGVHPELKGPPLSEDWLADLSSTKPLHQLADSAPQNLHGALLIDALLRARAPLVRATWLVKAAYLSQVRPLQISGVQDKSQGKRTDLWTKDLLAYLDNVLEGGENKLEKNPPTAEKEARWQQLVPLLLAHYAEGLLNPATTVDWALRHFADVSVHSADVSSPPRKIALLLPVALGLLEGLLQAHTQAHLQQLTKGALAWLEKLNPGGGLPNKLKTGGGLVLKLAELVRYVLLSAPDSFVGAGALPLPECVLRCESEEGEKVLAELQEKVIRKRASLAAAVNPVVLRNNEARVVTALSSALLRGDIEAACAVFDDPLVGGERELTAIIALVCNWAISTHGTESDNLLHIKSLLVGQSGKTELPLEADSQRNEPWSEDKTQSKKPPLVGESAKAKESKQKVASDFLAISRVYLAVSVLQKVSQDRNEFTPPQCHVALCEWLKTRSAGVNKLQEILLAQLACKGLLDRVRFARELVADGELLGARALSGARARAQSWRGILQQLPGEDLFAMEKRAALAVAGSRKRKLKESAAEGGIESIQRCISSLLDLPNRMEEAAMDRAIKRQRTEKEGERKVDWWWLKGKETVEVTQPRETSIEDDEIESRSTNASETKGLEERQSSESWGDFETQAAGLSYPQREKAAAWLLESTGLDRRRLKEVGWEEDVRWQIESEQQESGSMEVEKEQKKEEERVWVLNTKRLLCIVFMLDILGQHEMLVGVLLGLLTRASSSEEESFAKASGLRREDSFSVGSLLVLLQRYAPLIASMDRLPQLLSAIAKRASGESECLKESTEFVSHLRSEYGSLSWFVEWERSGQKTLGQFWAEVDRAVTNKKATRVTLGRDSETLRSTYRSVLERELGGAAKLLGEKNEIGREQMAKAAGNKLAQQRKEGIESIAAGIVAVIDIAADIETEGDLQKPQHLLEICAKFVESFGSGSERQNFPGGVALALERVVQEQAKKATSQPAPFHKMSPETPDLGSTTLPDSHETEDARAVLALALSVVLISQGTPNLRELLEVLQLEAAFKEGNETVTRASLRWFRVLFGGITNGDEIDSAVRALIKGPCAIFLSRDQAKLPLETVYAIISSLLRLAQSSHFETEAKSALLEALPILKERLLADTAGLYELIQADTLAADESELATWQETALELLPLQGTCLLRMLSEGKIAERDDFKTVEQLEAGIVEALLESLESIHTGNFHWRALEVRLLLAEQVTLEKLRAGSSAKDALASVRSQGALSESEKAFTTAVLTRLLTRPDAAPLYSQLAQMLGKEFSDYLIQQVRWALEGSDMLQGRKSLRQLLEASAQRDGFRISSADSASPFALEHSLAELVLPCLASSSSEVCAGFAADLVKQLAALEASVGARARAPDAAPRARADAPAWGRGLESSPRSGGGQWGSVASSAQTPPASAAALQTSIWLRLQFVLPMLPQIHADRDPSPRNMRLTFAPVLLRLLASPVIYHSSSLFSPNEASNHNLPSQKCSQAPIPKHLDFPSQKDSQAPNIALTSQNLPTPLKDTHAATNPENRHASKELVASRPPKKRDASIPERDAYAEAAAAAAGSISGESLFDRLMAVFTALMSATWQEWLKPLPGKGPPKVLRDVGPFERATAERMQAELDALRPNLPASIFQRLQSALPTLLPRRCTMPSIAAVKSSVKGTCFSSEGGDSAVEYDPWLLLEEGATGGHVPSNHVAPKAAPWLKGAIRVPRKELTYGPKEIEEELE